ncbi:MAG: ECF transporter S component [Candidatus Thorarchaeota archaeon]
MTERIAPQSLYVATVGVLGALMAVMAMFAVVLPPPLGSIDTSSILIFVTSILYGPAFGLIITCIGQLIGKGVLISSVGWPAVFIPGIVAVRGPEALIVGYIGRNKSLGRIREPLAMIIGVIWETGAFIVADFYLFGIAGAIGVVWTIIDLVWVPAAIAAIYYVRMSFRTEYLDKELGLVDPRAKKGFLITGLLFIVVSWIFILISGITGWGMLPLLP